MSLRDAGVRDRMDAQVPALGEGHSTRLCWGPPRCPRWGGKDRDPQLRERRP